MSKNIFKIRILDLAQHEDTNFVLGERGTFILAGNGTGKTTFSKGMEFEKKNNYKLEMLWSDVVSRIDLTSRKDKRRKNVIFYNKEKNEIDYRKNNFNPRVSVFSDLELWVDMNKHSMGESVQTLSMEKLVYEELKQVYEYYNKFSGIIEMANNRKIFNKKYRIFSSIGEVIFKEYNDKNKFSEWLKLFNGEVSLIKQAYDDIEDNLERKIFLFIFLIKNRKITHYILEEFFTIVPPRNRWISSRSKLAIENDFFESNESPNLTETQFKKAIENFKYLRWGGFMANEIQRKERSIRKIWRVKKDICIKITSIENYVELEKELKSQIEKAGNVLNEKKQENGDIKKAIEGIVSKTHLANKFKLTDHLEIKKNDKKVIISTGEMKFLLILKYIFEISYKQGDKKYDLIIFDDLFTSLDYDMFSLTFKAITKILHETNTQYIFLTHSETIYNEIIWNISKKEQNINLSLIKTKAKIKKAIKKVEKFNESYVFLEWTLDNSFNVHSKRFNTSDIFKNDMHMYIENIFDNNISNENRMNNARKLFEKIAWGITGQGSVSKIITNSDTNPKFIFFKKAIDLNINIYPFLNTYSHYRINTKNEITQHHHSLNKALEEIKRLIKCLGLRK